MTTILQVLHGLLAVPGVKGFLTGGVIALGVDIHAWTASEEPFNVKKSIKRVIGGAITGSGLLAGMNQV